MADRARITLVTIIAGFRLQDRVLSDLRKLGVTDYTLCGEANGPLLGFHLSRPRPGSRDRSLGN